ncbi:MAG: hypothetical protein HFI53_08370 [Lachnospiraceae bacterium]|nr:hypothetical protein [Lachnospiraceae bacterium]
MKICAVIFLCLSLIPLLWLGKYNVMCIDDYDYGTRVHDVWQETGDFYASVQEAWRQNMDFYREWQGTYVSCFLMGLCPMNFNYGIAWVVPVLMIGMLASSSFVLGRHAFIRWLGCDQEGASLIMALLLFVFYQVMEAPFEGIYWYNGSTHYVLMQSVWFFVLTLVSGAVWAEKKGRAAVCCITAAVLAVIVAGGNLVTGLQAEILMVFLILYAFCRKRDRIAYVIIPFVTGSAGFLVNVIAPGNVRRGSMDLDEGYSAVKSVALSFYHTAVFAIRWTPVLMVILWIALLPLLWKLAKASRRDFSHPVLVTAGAYCVISAMFTPTLYAVGMVGLSRVDTIIQMTYYLAVFLVTAYWMGYFSHRRKRTDGAAEAFGLFLERAGNRMTVLGLFLLLAVWLLTADKNTYTSISALRSVVNGDAQTFYREAMERHELYTDEDILQVEVAPYSARPALFDFNDLTQDEGNWLNVAVARYYHKDSVRSVRSTSTDVAP